MTEPFDAVLAEMREWATRYESNGSAALATNLRDYSDRLDAAHAAEVAERDARLNGEKFAHEQTKRALAEATETWTDEAGNTWRPPTAWAYAQSCRVRDEMRQRAEAAERDARSKQARIDALMLEYCPEDMTPEQVAEWKGAIATTGQADED